MSDRERKRWRHQATAKAARTARKEMKRNRKPKRVRRKDWKSYSFKSPELFDELDIPTAERIMPRGEQERRRANMRTEPAVMEDRNDSIQELPAGVDAQGRRGIVVEVSSSLCRVDLGSQSLVCSLRGSLSAKESAYTNVVAVGDEVIVSAGKTGQGVVEAVLPRQGCLTRPDVFHSHLQQVIVANIHQVLIVASWREPHIWLELIDRYLIAAERAKLQPIICLNKVDLAEEIESCRAILRPYLDLGYGVIFTSALTGQGVGRLRKVLNRRTTALAGLSGVGKSSLLSAVQPGLELRTGEVSEQSGEGRHVTKQVKLHRLEIGGFVADTPGIREFGLSSLRQCELAQYYPEFTAVSRRCRFVDCAHIHEPDCAVKAAVRQSRISSTRYHNYKKICHTLPA